MISDIQKLRCQWEIDSKTTSDANFVNEVREQTMEEQILKRPIITCTTETRPDTNRTLQMIRTAEMKTLRSIQGKKIQQNTERRYQTTGTKVVNQTYKKRLKSKNK